MIKKKASKSFHAVIIIAWIVGLSTLVVAGAVVLFSSHVFQQGNLTTTVIGTEAKVEFSANTATSDIIFTKGGEQHPFTLSMKNSTEGHLLFRYELTHNATSELASAILVYYDEQFVGTLGELCSIGDGYVGNAVLGFGFVAQGQTDASHTLTLELHEAVPNSYYDKEELTLTLTAYTESIDYQKYLFVTNEDEFSRAVDDINSGMLSEPCIVIGQSVTLTRDYTISYPTTIELNSHVLELGGKTLTLNGSGRYTFTSLSPCEVSTLATTGNIVLNHTEALLDIADIPAQGDVNIGISYGSMVTLQNYDSASASALLLERIEKSFAHGAYAGETVHLFGAISFYTQALTVTSEFGTLIGDTLTLPSATTTAQCRITVNDTSMDLKVIGSDDAALAQIKQTILSHLPTDEHEKITSDVFLPVSSPLHNATITWVSANEDTISSQGNISNVVKDNAPITLYAYIRINDKVYTESYSFHVSSQNNETKFSYLVAQLSPIILDTVFAKDEENATNNGALAYHHLPIVNDESKYDYRSNFSTPTARSSPYTWLAYKDIGLEKLEYSISTTYNYVSVETDQSGNVYAYLNAAVFYDYAQINIKGTFKNGEEYEGIVNVTISLGDDADLQNKVFRFVESMLNEVDVLQNIIDTRAAQGMLNERGDFYLPPRYMTYAINYSIPASSTNIISEIVAPGAASSNGQINESDMYLIKVNPAYFYASDTVVGINVSIKPESSDISSETRILYFNIPPVIKPDESGFNNLGVFNAVKYQIYQQLPAEERDGESGFTLSGAALKNETGAYILCRDAAYATTLTLNVKKDSVTTDNSEIYTLMRLLEWATGKEKLPASTAWSSGGSTLSDGEDFLTDPEINVIKNYWRSATGEALPDELWNTVFQKAIGRVILDGDALYEAIQNINMNMNNHFKYIEMMNFVLDKQNFGVKAGGQWEGSPPNLGTFKRQYSYSNGKYTYANQTISSSNYKETKYYTNSYYQEDQSPYISEAETELLCVMVLNLAYDTSTGTKTDQKGHDFVNAFFANTTIPTYLNAGGIGLLTDAFYEALGTKADDFTSQVTVLNGYNVPSVTNLDNSLTALQYLTGLTKLYIYGEQPSGTDQGLAAFLTTTGLSGFFNHITAVNQAFTDLEMTLVARNYVTFDVTFTERLTSLTHLNYSYNEGITNVGPLVNLPMANIQYLNIAGVDVSFEFSDYVMSNIYAATNHTATILYYPDNTTTLTRYGYEGAVDESLTYLNEIGQIKSEYLQLCPSLATGSGLKNIYWRIESGNMMTYVTVAGELTSIPAVENYYYCTTSFSGTLSGHSYEFIQGHVYAFNRNGDGYFTDLGTFTVVQGIPNTTEFSDEEKAAATLKDSANSEQTIGSTTTYNNSVTSTAKGTVRNLQNNNQATNRGRYGTITLKMSNGSTQTIENITRIGCDRSIQKTVVEQITVTREAAWEATKDLVYYDESTNTVVTCTYTYLKQEDQYTQTYERTTVYWSNDYYYRTNGSNTNRYLSANANYLDWVSFDFKYYTSRNSTTTVTINAYVQQNGNPTSTYDENNFTLVPGSTGESVTKTNEQVLISPVGELSGIAQVEALRTMMEAAIRGGVYYHYTGNNRTVDYYNNSTTRAKQFNFARNTVYRASVDANGFVSWTADNSLSASVGTGGMDAILAEANNHLNDPLYGMYYGMYYAYNGAAFTTLLGNVYQPGYIYRLLIGDDGRFYFEHDDTEKMGIKNTFTVVTTINQTNGLLDRAREANQSNVGDIYYYSSDSTNPDTHYFHQPNLFYTITYAEEGFYYARTFGCADAVFEQEGNGSYTLRFQNQRIFYVTGSSSELYSGTGGTEYTIVSALVETDNGLALRKFLVKIIG